MAVKLIVDSTCDLSIEEIERLGLLRAPLTLHWDGKEYCDGVDMSPAKFFERLVGSNTLPTTSQVPVPVFEDLFRQVVGAGDEAVVMTLSHNLSGTYQSATIARESLEDQADRIHLVDNGTASLGSMLLVDEAVRMRDSGSTASEIVERLNDIKGRLAIYACVETLKFLHKGGRLSAGAAVVGTLLSVKPVLCIEDGLISVANKVRGNAAAYSWLAAKMAELGHDSDYPVVVGSTQCPELVTQFTSTVTAKTGIAFNRFCDIGTVIGTHIGPGTVAVAFIKPRK